MMDYRDRDKARRERIASGWTSLRVTRQTVALLDLAKKRSRRWASADEFIAALVTAELARLDEADALAERREAAAEKARAATK